MSGVPSSSTVPARSAAASNPAPAAPPQPLYILRAHTTPVHALHFTPSNTHLLTGDSSGHIILWSLPTRRPISIFHPHTSALLSITTINTPSPTLRSPPYILTHARDHTLKLFRFPSDPDVPIPATATTATIYNVPELVAGIAVNALNFCGASVLDEEEGVLVAVPSPLETEGVDVMTLPEGRRVHANVQAPGKTGMAMAVKLGRSGSGALQLCVGYESGDVAVLREKAGSAEEQGGWETVLFRREHKQPILGLAVHGSSLWSSSADARITRYTIGSGEGEVRVKETGHSGQQGIVSRDDGEIVATAGWDGVVRVYRGVKGMRELAVLKWHRDGVYAVEFGRILHWERGQGAGANDGEGKVVVHRTMEEERVWRETRRHWLAAGAKDGRVSLWEIY